MERLRHGELELTGVNGGADKEWVSTRDSATVVLFIGVLGFVSKQGTLGEGRFGWRRADGTGRRQTSTAAAMQAWQGVVASGQVVQDACPSPARLAGMSKGETGGGNGPN